MFEWLTDMEHNIDFNGVDAYIAQYNPETKKFIVENEEGTASGILYIKLKKKIVNIYL